MPIFLSARTNIYAGLWIEDMADVFTKKKRSAIMARIRSKNTKPEKLLRAGLRKLGLHFKSHYNIFGHPDIVFPNEKVAIFVDGDFWHGYNLKIKKQIPPRRYWLAKILRNIQRDKVVSKNLKNHGWKVIRIWEHNIVKRPEKYAKQIRASIPLKDRR